MKQINKYTVERIGQQGIGILNESDSKLLNEEVIRFGEFIPQKHTLNVNVYDLDGNFIETHPNIKSYTVPGNVQGGVIRRINIDPVLDSRNFGYLGDVILEYEALNNVYSSQLENDSRSTFYLYQISSNRQEIRAKSVQISETDLKSYTSDLYNKLNNSEYFTEFFLKFDSVNSKVTVVNVATEVLDDNSISIAFKLYEPLPLDINIKDIFTVQEKIGESTSFKVLRSVELQEESEKFYLKKPNFEIEVDTNEEETDYLNYTDLFSYPLYSSEYNIYNFYKDKGVQLSIDYSRFDQFIHFSSARERLENFRFKLELIFEYQRVIDELIQKGIPESNSQIVRYRKSIDGIISNFDHYDNYLYFENKATSWPKESNTRPYINVDPENVDEDWWTNLLEQASNYDENNQDRLVNSIPDAIKDNKDNESYVVFVDMIGQHFDNQWIYAKALSDRYNGDNRLNVGISKDLVKESVQSFGLSLQDSYQNLDRLFQACNIDGTYNTGSEASVLEFRKLATTGELQRYQPIHVDTYSKAVYKRIYHNLPYLLKTKGTERGLKALIACFGIPESILQINVLGNRNTTTSYFGPLTGTTSSIDRIHIQDTLEKPLYYSGSVFESASVLVPELSTVETTREYSDGSHQVEIGFNLSKQVNDFYSSKVDRSFSYDGIVGDPGNLEENYGNSFKQVVNQIKTVEGLPELRSPSAIIRLVRYFDLTLFNSLSQFLPGRVEASAGAIVENNILNRNKYRGVQPTGETKDYFAELDLESISGSSGGSYNNVPVRNPRTREEVQHVVSKGLVGGTFTVTSSVFHEKPWSTSTGTGTKVIFDDSPKYTGELGGSLLELTNETLYNDNFYRGETVHGNPYLHDKEGKSNYIVNFKFLSLPDDNLKCTIVLSGISENKGIVQFYRQKAGIKANYFTDTVDFVVNGGTYSASIEDVLDGGLYNVSPEHLNTTDGGYANSWSLDYGSRYVFSVTGNSGIVSYTPDDYYLNLNISSIPTNVKFLGWFKGYISSSDKTPRFSDYLGDGTKMSVDLRNLNATGKQNFNGKLEESFSDFTLRASTGNSTVYQITYSDKTIHIPSGNLLKVIVKVKTTIPDTDHFERVYYIESSPQSDVKVNVVNPAERIVACGIQELTVNADNTMSASVGAKYIYDSKGNILEPVWVSF